MQLLSCALMCELTACCHAVLKRLILDNTGATDEVLPLLAPLAGSLEYLRVRYSHVSEAGVQATFEAFVEHGGGPKIDCSGD